MFAKINLIPRFLILATLFCFSIQSVEGLPPFPRAIPQKKEREKKKEKIKVKVEENPLLPYLLPENHHLQVVLKKLLNNSNMFRSPTHFRQAGFQVKMGHKHLMVGAHPSMPDHLIKRFPDSVPSIMQLENFIKRINGANLIRELIKERNYDRLVVPKKWVYQLPSSFAKFPSTKSYILIVEKMDIYNEKENHEHYYKMDEETLTQLCSTLHAIGGCDGYPRNQPFIKTGQIAFVDTEHVGEMKDHFHKHIIPALSPDMQIFADQLWRELERAEQGAMRKN